MIKIALIVPCFNEGPRFPGFARALAANAAGVQLSLVVVDDGSGEAHRAVTRRAAQDLAGAGLDVRYLSYPANRGKGYAVRYGWAWAEKELENISYYGFCDADEAIPGRELQRFFGLLSEQLPEALVGVRAAGRPVRRSLPRKAASLCFNSFTRLLLDLGTGDTQCGLKFLSAKAYRAVAGSLALDRYGLDLEILHALKKNGLAVRQEPVEWIQVGNSKVSLLRDGFVLARDVVRLFIKDKFGRAAADVS